LACYPINDRDYTLLFYLHSFKSYLDKSMFLELLEAMDRELKKKLISEKETKEKEAFQNKKKWQKKNIVF